MRLARYWSPGRIAPALTAVSLLLWAHSLLFARLEVGDFGLIHGLPATFFISLALLTVAAACLWNSRSAHTRLLTVQTVLFVGMLWLVPAVTGGSPPLDDHAYRNLRLIDHIVSQGHFSAQEVGYLSWPGAFIWVASLSELLAIDFEPLMDFFPVILQILFLLPLYVFLKNTLGEEQRGRCWAGLWLFTLASWTGREYLSSAPGVGLLLLLVLLALLTTPGILEKHRRGAGLLALTGATFVALAVTHLLTSLAALGMLAALALARRNKRLVYAAGACFVVLLAWNLTGMERDTILGAFSQDAVYPEETVWAEEPDPVVTPQGTIASPEPQPMVTGRTPVLSADVFLKAQITGHISGDPGHVAAVQTRLGLSAGFVVLGVAGAVAALLSRRDRRTAIVILLMTAAPFALAVLPYGGRVLDHLYVFSLAPMALFGARLLKVHPVVTVPIVAVLIMVAIPFHLIAHYGNQAFDYHPDSLAAGLDYAYDRADAPTPISDRYPWATLEPPRAPFLNISQLQWRGNEAIDDRASWLYFHSRQAAFYDFILAAPSFVAAVEDALAKTTNCQLVYQNSDFRLYSLSPAETYQGWGAGSGERDSKSN